MWWIYTQILYKVLHNWVFFPVNGYSITQTWGGLGSQIEIEQPIKHKDLWNEHAFLAKESAISLCVLGK